MLLLEYLGTLLVCATVLYTHSNPLLVGLSHMSALYITNGHFNPLFVTVDYTLGRIPPLRALKLLAVQYLAAYSALLVFSNTPLE